MLRAIAVYNLLLSLALSITGVASAESLNQGLIGVLFIPVTIYYVRKLRRILRQRQTTGHALSVAPKTAYPAGNHITSAPLTPSTAIEGEEVSSADVRDINKRLFLKLIGSAGLTTFIFALFTKSSQAAFFGSVPGPGTVSLKDTAGNKIDPAEKQPTHGYEISQMDDTTIPAYYGFLNKEGAWYIAKEGNGGEFRYTRGSTNFATSWTNRSGLAYNYFNEVF
jgi:hypothetical protein